MGAPTAIIGDGHGRNGSLRGHAEACVAAGLCALPAVRRGDEKRPALASWKLYQSQLPTGDEIGAWFAEPMDADDNGRSMCLVCGCISGNLEMIDFDNWDGGGGEAFDAWRESVEAQKPGLIDRLVIETTPSGGRHVVYRCEAPVSGNTKLAQRWIESGGPEPIVVGAKEYVPRRDAASGVWHAAVTMIETRGEGGLFLCAPSDGYELLHGDLAEPPVVTTEERDVLLGAAWSLDETPRPIVDAPPRPADVHGYAPQGAGVRPGDEFNERGDVRELLTRHGWRLVKQGDNEHWCRPGKSAGTSATLKDRVFYVFSSNAPPFEPQKAYAPFAVYALLEHSGDFTKAAAALATDGFGSSERSHGVDLSGFTVTPAFAGPDLDGPLMPAPVPVGELVTAYPKLRDPVIHGLLREGETMNVIASPKTGKSWLTLDLAIAVATGRDWLGRYKTVSGDVLIIDNELHRETSAHRIPRVADARGVAMREIAGRILVDNLRGRLQDIFTLGPYFEAIEPGRYKVIVLDAFYRFMPAGGDENDNGTMANIYNRIDSFADRLGCCFVLIHHSTKGSQSGKSVTDVGAGAGAQSRATDTHLVLRPHEEEGVVVLDAAVRSWAPVDPTCLRWDFPVWNADRSLDPAELKNEKGGKKKEKAQHTPQTFVKTFVNGVPSTRSVILERAVQAGVSQWRADQLLRTADSDGLMIREGDGKRNAPFLYRSGDADPAGESSP
ncbi:MAG: AAA family ATPase [Planctomycetota bacterium]